MRGLICTFLAVLVFALGTAWAQDARIAQAYALMDQEDWDAAGDLAASALADAENDEARFAAREILATLDYYFDETDAPLAALVALDRDAVDLFGPLDARRLPALELLGSTHADLGNITQATRALTQGVRIARITGADADTLQFGLLKLASAYLQAGMPDTAAIIAADLNAVAAYEFGEDDEIALEAGLIRALAHLDMGHPVEALIHALAPIDFGQDRLGDEFPDVGNMMDEFIAALEFHAGSTGPDIEQTIAVWLKQARAKSGLRATEAADMSGLEALQMALLGKDTAQANQIARQLSERVLADDPGVAKLYSIMIFTHLRDDNPGAAAVWGKRLAALPVGYLATLEGQPAAHFVQIADWLGLQGRQDDGLDLLDRAIQISDLRDGPDAVSVQRLRMEKTEALFFAGQYARAEAETEQALQSNRSHHTAEPVLHAELLILSGELRAALNDITSAENLFRQAATLLSNAALTGDMRWAKLLYSLAQVQSRTGADEDAIELMRQSLAIRIAVSGEISSATQIGQIGLAAVLANAGLPDQALAVYAAARAKIETATGVDNSFRVPLMFGEAKLLRVLGRTEQADQLQAQATIFLEAVPGETPTMQPARLAYEQLAWDAWSEDRFDDAIRYADLAVDGVSAQDPFLTGIQALKGRIALERADDVGALDLFRTVTEAIRMPGGQRLLSARDHFPMHIEAALRRADQTDGPQSLQLTDEAFAIAQQVNELSAGNALSRASARWETSPELSQKVRRLQDIETEITNLNTAFSSALVQGGDGAEIQQQLQAANALFEHVQHQVQTEFPDYSAIAAPSPVALQKAAAWLHPDEVLVLYATSDENTPAGLQGSVIFAVTRDTIRTGIAPSRTELSEVARQLRCAAALTDARCGRGADKTRGSFSLDGPVAENIPQGPQFDTSLAHRAYEAVLGPVAGSLAGKSRLIVVPDQALIAMPFHLLVQNAPQTDMPLQTADWLIRDMSVFVVPTVASLDALRTQRRGKIHETNRFLGIGDPLIGVQRNGKIEFDCGDDRLEPVFSAALDTSPAENIIRNGMVDADAIIELSALPDTRCELKSALGHFDDGSQLLLHGNATEAVLKQMSASGQLAEFATISFATHGLIAGEIGDHDAGLVLSPPDQPSLRDDGLLSTGEIAELKLDADIVFLSACNTAAGDGQNSQGLSGLASAFFYAGARSLLVSHWPVYSDAATELTTAMLSRMQTDPDLGYADALRLAMLAILDDPNSDARKRHPAYWAPFMIVGEGAVAG